MAEAFLRQLLQVHNRVESDEEQTCVICIENCGTMNEATGLLELAIRLPSCKHIVGSGCIAQWLHSNNTCPLCRRVLFSTQSHLHHESSILEGQTGDVQTSRAQTARNQILSGPISGVIHFLEEMKRLCRDYCTQLDLNPSVARIAAHLVTNLLDSGPSNAILQDRSDHCVVAVSIYIASNLVGCVRSPLHISGVIGDVDGRHIHATYELLTDLRAIIDDDIRNDLDRVFNIQSLVWPPHGNEMVTRQSALEDLTHICSDYCVMLGLPVAVRLTASRIAGITWHIAPFHQLHRASRTLAVACVYVAVHLMGSSRFLSRISQETQVSEDGVAQMYRHIYAEREHIVRQHWLPDIENSDDAERALANLPIP